MVHLCSVHFFFDGLQEDLFSVQDPWSPVAGFLGLLVERKLNHTNKRQEKRNKNYTLETVLNLPIDYLLLVPEREHLALAIRWFREMTELLTEHKSC